MLMCVADITLLSQKLIDKYKIDAQLKHDFSLILVSDPLWLL